MEEKKEDFIASSSHLNRPDAPIIPTLTRRGERLHPQPTSDPLDPLLWSTTRKHSMLAVVMALYFMFTYITTTTVPSFPELGTLFNASVSQINWTVAIPALGLAIGPLIWSSLSDIYGRRIVFISGTIIAFASTIGAAKATDYSGYMAARFFQGLGVSPASTVGLAIINDMFYEYQRGQKIGLWVISIDLGLLIGPLVGGFMDLVSQAWIEWLTAILFAVILVAELTFLPETLYPRNRMLASMPYTDKGSHASANADVEKSVSIERNAPVADIETTTMRESAESDVSLKRTKRLPFINLKPVPGLRHPKVWEAALRFCQLWKYLAVSLPIGLYCVGWYWWILSIITMIPVAYVQYSPQTQGLFFIGLILGTLVAEIFFSGTLSDYIFIRSLKKSGGVRVPETRLWLVYPASILSAVGLIIWGISIDKAYHWIVGQVAFALFAAGIQMGNTAIAAYVIDAYPLQSMSVIVFYAVLLNLSAFVNPFFIAPWVTTDGYTWTFAVQGILTAVTGCVGIGFVHWKGGWMREIAGMPSWVNPEYDSVA